MIIMTTDENVFRKKARERLAKLRAAGVQLTGRSSSNPQHVEQTMLDWMALTGKRIATASAIMILEENEK